MNWRRGLLRLWLALSLCWIVAVGVYAWKQEAWIWSQWQLASFDIEGARAAGYTDQEIAKHLTEKFPQFDVRGATGYSFGDQILAVTTINIGGQSVWVDSGFKELSPEEKNETVDKIRSSIFAITARRYAAYAFLPPLTTLVLGLLIAWVASGFARKGAGPLQG
jgi:hypothetical protein